MFFRALTIGLSTIASILGRSFAHILPPESDWIEEEIPGMGKGAKADTEIQDIIKRYRDGDAKAVGDGGLGIEFCNDREILTFNAHDAYSNGALDSTWLMDVVGTMRSCGLAIVIDAFEPEFCGLLRESLETWKEGSSDHYEMLSTWQLRKGRLETFLPHLHPFNSSTLIANELILKIMDRYLSNRTFNDEFGGYYNKEDKALLDLVTWINALPKAQSQDVHRDVLWGGSTTVHVVLHNITESFAPTVFWPATHKDTPLEGSILSLDPMPAVAPVGAAIMYDSSIMHFGGANEENVNRNAIFLDYMTDELHGKKYPFFIKASMYPEHKEKEILSNIFRMRDAYGQYIGRDPPSWLPKTGEDRDKRQGQWFSWLEARIQKHRATLRERQGIKVVD